MFNSLRGARGTHQRVLFDHEVDKWHLACLDGRWDLHLDVLDDWNRFYSRWLNITNEGTDINVGNLEEAVGIVETLGKIGPKLATQTLFWGEPGQGRLIGSALRYVGLRHREYADNHGGSPFGDAFGVAVFKGSRIDALCYRHEHDGDWNPVDSPIPRFLNILHHIEAQRETRCPDHGRDVSDLPPLLEDPAAHRNCAMALARYRTYVATIEHDITRYLLKRFFFSKGLSDEEMDLLGKMAGQYMDHSETLPALFERPVRYDTRTRHFLFRGDLEEAYHRCQTFSIRYPEASVADHGIIMETKVLCLIDSHLTDRPLAPGLHFDPTTLNFYRSQLDTLTLKYNMWCFSQNCRLLMRKYAFL